MQTCKAVQASNGTIAIVIDPKAVVRMSDKGNQIVADENFTPLEVKIDGKDRTLKVKLVAIVTKPKES